MKSKSSFFPFVITPIVLYSTGTYNKDDNTGGSNGATMRFAPESTDDANAGLGIVRDLLLPIKKAVVVIVIITAILLTMDQQLDRLVLLNMVLTRAV